MQKILLDRPASRCMVRRVIAGKSYGVGLAGLGTVGSGVWNVLKKNGALISQRTGVAATGVDLRVTKILVRDLVKARTTVDVAPPEIFTTSWQELVADLAVDIVVELIGGTADAFELVAAALRARKPVVTANKALLAERGAELFALSREMNTPIYFEAAVAAGIPIIRALQDSLVGNRIRSISGIINGTSNYILGRMAGDRLDFEAALKEAQALGYAEADPALDVNGRDAAHKAILLASLAFGFPIEPSQIHISGIEKVRQTDLAFANTLGYVVKLLAVVREHANGAVELRVQPSFVAKSHILASVHGVFNAIAVQGDAAGESLYYGRGAGQEPTASAVVADLVEAARSLQHEAGHRGFLPYLKEGKILPVEETETAYYIRFDVTDRPGVLAEIAQVLADHAIGVSGIHSPVDSSRPDAQFVDMVFMLHTCSFGRLQTALSNAEKLDCINSEPVVFRIEALG